MRNRGEYDAAKSKIVVEAGAATLIVHVRVGNLPPLQHPGALTVAVPESSTPYQRACAVAAAISGRYPGSIPKMAGYLAGGRARGQAQAEAYINTAWGQLRPPRLKPRRSTPPQPRRLRATDPSPGSLLTPDGDPYRNLERPAEILRKYHCACGNPETVIAVQAQVSSGNTRSCGCLQHQARHQKRPSVPRAETQAAREWAQRNGIETGSNGRLPDRVIASYRLSQAGRPELLGADELLLEQSVQQWAQAAGRPLNARGRVPGSLWLEFAEEQMEGERQIMAALRDGSVGHSRAPSAQHPLPASP